MMYNFDEIIDRRNTNAMSTDGFRDYIFGANDSMTFPYKDDDFIRMWVADMDFATPKVIIDAIKERLDKRIFGYTQYKMKMMKAIQIPSKGKKMKLVEIPVPRASHCSEYFCVNF
ncbi:hypothetical protein [Scopulibacillus cellulosilyticus]|uniref:Uncharacterized protein n=1 Tax=Scopulibacillus cellulosilyticus TaxID=2665665 RepID=A0ABW2PXV5_9BACL